MSNSCGWHMAAGLAERPIFTKLIFRMLFLEAQIYME
jgi:hypothetical protein